MHPLARRAASLCLAFASLALPAHADTTGYYREPAIHGDTIVFVAEGDLWRVKADGGVASRLTSHPGEETSPAISPDGRTLAFVAHYEGPGEVYTMPLTGGLPLRRTWGMNRARVAGWTPDGKLLLSTRRFSTLPDLQLVQLDVSRQDGTGDLSRVPLSQAAGGSYDGNSDTLFFTRLPFQGSHTKRYKGGTAQNIWRFARGDEEATPLTGDFTGTSKSPMWWRDRVYFISDRDGTMNLWSMDEDGGDLNQHTRLAGWQEPAHSLGCIRRGRAVVDTGQRGRRESAAHQ